MKRSIRVILYKAAAIGWCILLLGTGLYGQALTGSEEDEAVTLVRNIYEEISCDGSEPVDWDLVRSHFLEDAVIVLRSSREGHSVFTLDEFIADFKTFYENPRVKETGFREEVLRIKPQIFRDAASIPVVYEASILGSESPPQKGIDFWILVRRDQEWKVVGISNEIIPPGTDIPDLFN